MHRALSLSAAVALLAAAPLRAQQSAPPVEIRSGSRVRLEAPGVVADQMVARVISRTADTLTIAGFDSPPVAVPIARITRLDISRGDSRAAGALHGMKWGAPIGLGLGALMVVLSDDCETCKNQPSAGAAMGDLAAAGAFIGAIAGAIAQHEQWSPVTLSPRVSFDAGAPRGVLALRARF